MNAIRLMTLCALLAGFNAGAQDTGKPLPAASKQEAKAADANGQNAKAKKAEAPVAKTNGQRGTDQLTLDATTVTGNRELPKVMYIVPWKKAELSTLPGQPFNTLMDEALAPVDREVFRREVAYYDVIAEKDQAGGKPAGGVQPTAGADKK